MPYKIKGPRINLTKNKNEVKDSTEMEENNEMEEYLSLL
jgi:hypothetical protein